MTFTTHDTPSSDAEKAMALALRLAHAENALHAFTSGQVDAVLDPDGNAYLLRPAQEHLRETGMRLQSMLECVPDVITVVNRGGVIVSQNSAAKSVLGCEERGLIGSKLFEHVHEDDLAALFTAFFNVIEGFQERGVAQFRHRAGDGSYRTISATMSRLGEESSGSVVFSLRQAASTVLKFPKPVARKPTPVSTTETVDRFLAILSHELRTPLTPVLLAVEELEEDERFAEMRPKLAMIRRNIVLQGRLIEELKDFTAIGENKLRLCLESLDAHDALQDVLKICHGEIAGANVEVLLDLRASAQMVRADSMRIRQVMWNLVRNAVKFSPPGSTIFIASANEVPSTLTLEFTDKGIGMDPSLLPLIFAPFIQGDEPKQNTGGLGLGLFIARGLAEAQGGTLTAHSQGRGKGAKFRLTLPTSPLSETQIAPMSLPITS